ncbi:MAG: very short patch repair endonuclease [Jatrophihabitantaceae bacterium]
MQSRRDPAVTSKIMAAVRSKDTEPELLLRRELHRRGLRYRLHGRLPGRPDLVFGPARLVVFVDGDFWHGHGWRERGFTSWEAQFDRHRDPARWRAKIGRNIARDAEVNAQLTESGWQVLRVLESEVRRDPAAIADRVEAEVAARRPRRTGPRDA